MGGTIKSYNTHVIVDEGAGVTGIAAGIKYILILTAEGIVGAIGDLEYIDGIVGHSNVEKIAAGPYHILLLLCNTITKFPVSLCKPD